MNIEQQLQKALIELNKLKQENEYLKTLLNKHNIPLSKIKTTNEGNMITNYSPPEKKVNLFMSLFKGRNDVYAVRWDSANGRSGYSPACEHEWKPTICNKPTIKCQDCSHRKFLNLNHRAIQNHLLGKQTIGIYPLLNNHTSWFLAVDFDKSQWKVDVIAFNEACNEFNVPCSIEISRSGNGAHVWIFFEEAVEAKLARKLGNFLLEHASKKRYQVQLDSYDRLFPNQDKMPIGGFGNLIALPLQKIPRQKGFSSFVNETFKPYEDQWAYLSTIKKINSKDIVKIIDISTQNKEVTINEFTGPVQIILREGIHFKKKLLPTELLSRLIKLASFSNPEYYRCVAARRSTHRIPKRIYCMVDSENELILPRGCLDDVENLLKEFKIPFKINDYTSLGKEIDITFQGQLYYQQEEALQHLKKHTIGVLSATTGFGKTVLGAALIAENKRSSLVIVHNTTLLHQWKERLASFLNIQPNQIGQLGDGKKKQTSFIDIATIQTLSRYDDLENFNSHYGLVIVDECHHISAVSFEKVIKQLNSHYVYGLSATPTRKDGLHPIISMQCGPIRYKVDSKNQSKLQNFIQQIVIRETNFASKSMKIQELYQELYEDKNRNELIFNDVLQVLEEKRYALILTQRVEHALMLAKNFKGFARNIILLSGHLSKKERIHQIEKLKNLPVNEERLVIATGKYIGEGFDYDLFDTLFLVMPISWQGTLQQYVGRLHRANSSKSIVKVYDYVDQSVPMLKNMYEKRLKGYNLLGYKEEKIEFKQLKLL